MESAQTAATCSFQRNLHIQLAVGGGGKAFDGRFKHQQNLFIVFPFWHPASTRWDKLLRPWNLLVDRVKISQMGSDRTDPFGKQPTPGPLTWLTSTRVRSFTPAAHAPGHFTIRSSRKNYNHRHAIKDINQRVKREQRCWKRLQKFAVNTSYFHSHQNCISLIFLMYLFFIFKFQQLN